jgi:hypothetical protein
VWRALGNESLYSLLKYRRWNIVPPRADPLRSLECSIERFESSWLFYRLFFLILSFELLSLVRLKKSFIIILIKKLANYQTSSSILWLLCTFGASIPSCKHHFHQFIGVAFVPSLSYPLHTVVRLVCRVCCLLLSAFHDTGVQSNPWLESR